MPKRKPKPPPVPPPPTPVPLELRRKPTVTIAGELKKIHKRQEFISGKNTLGVVDGAFAMLPGGRPEGLKFALLAAKEETEPGVPAHPWLVHFFERVDSLCDEDYNFKSVDELLHESGCDPGKFLGLVVEQAVRHGTDVARMVAASAMPQVIQKTVERAKGSRGQVDTRFLGEITGILPTRAGMVINQGLFVGGRAKDGRIVRDEGPGLPSFETESVESCQIMRNGADEPEEEVVE